MLQMFVLALSLYNTWNRGVFLLCKITNLLIYRSQLMRGTLEGCILKILSKNTSYGYEIVTTLLGYGFKDIKEGTIYPLLVRLEKKGIITSEMQPSPLGPSRKYYSITPDGVEYLNEFKTNWKQISQSVNQVFDTEV